MACESCLTKIRTGFFFFFPTSKSYIRLEICRGKNTCIQLLFQDHMGQFSYQHQTKHLQSKGTRVFPSWRNFPDETYVFSKDSRLTAQTRLLHSPKCSQAVSTARESTNYIVEQPLKPALNLSLWGNSEELAVCPGLGKALMSPHTLVP